MLDDHVHAIPKVPLKWATPPNPRWNNTLPIGWECPKCGMVMAPAERNCTHCKPRHKVIAARLRRTKNEMPDTYVTYGAYEDPI